MPPTTQIALGLIATACRSIGPNDSWDQSKMLTDGVHPNKVGHGLLFDVVVTADIPTATFGS